MKRDFEFHNPRCYGNKAYDDVCNLFDHGNEENEMRMRYKIE